jgi:hypothetical protein
VIRLCRPSSLVYIHSSSSSTTINSLVLCCPCVHIDGNLLTLFYVRLCRRVLVFFWLFFDFAVFAIQILCDCLAIGRYIRFGWNQFVYRTIYLNVLDRYIHNMHYLHRYIHQLLMRIRLRYINNLPEKLR